jgi:hypothetical protein
MLKLLKLNGKDVECWKDNLLFVISIHHTKYIVILASI